MASPRPRSKSPSAKSAGRKLGPAPTKKAAPAAKKGPSTMEIIQEALSMTEERDGLSVHSIKSYANEHYPDVAFKNRLKSTLLKGMESGALTRPRRSAGVTGVQGFFKVSCGCFFVCVFSKSLTMQNFFFLSFCVPP